MSDLVKALWVGFDSVLPDGTKLFQGVTVHPVGASEAAQSDNWQPVKADTPKPPKTEKEG